MRDYYAEFLIKYSGNSPETKVSKVSEPSFDTFDTNISKANQDFLSLESLLEDSELKEQYEFEIKERTAIMMFDSGLPEAEAMVLARQCVEETWRGFFITELRKV